MLNKNPSGCCVDYKGANWILKGAKVKASRQSRSYFNIFQYPAYESTKVVGNGNGETHTHTKSIKRVIVQS